MESVVACGKDSLWTNEVTESGFVLGGSASARMGVNGMGFCRLGLVIFSASFIAVPVWSQDVGVQIGDRARWGVETVWSSNLSGENRTSLVEFMGGVEALEAAVRWVASTSVKYDLTGTYLARAGLLL